MSSKAWSRYPGAYLKQLPIADDRNLVNSVSENFKYSNLTSQGTI